MAALGSSFAAGPSVRSTVDRGRSSEAEAVDREASASGERIPPVSGDASYQ